MTDSHAIARAAPSKRSVRTGAAVTVTDEGSRASALGATAHRRHAPIPAE